MGVLDHHNRRIDHCADGDGDAAEAHDVGAEPQQPHADIGHEHAERQRDDSDHRAAGVQQEDDADERDDEAFLEQGSLQRVDGAVDQVGAIVDGVDGHALRQARRNLGEAILDVLNYGQGILTETLERDTGDDLPFSIHFGDAATLVGR